MSELDDGKPASGKMLAFDPANHATNDIYKLMVGSIVPRPIAITFDISAEYSVEMSLSSKCW